LSPGAEAGASGSRSDLCRQVGEESPNTARQSASCVRLERRKRGSCRQYPAGTESITENIHPGFFDKKKSRKGEKVV
jgi:hypothetical protein